MAEEDIPIITESEWNSRFGGNSGSEDIPVITESEWNSTFASPGVEKLLGEDTKNRFTKAARIGAGGLSQFIPFGDEITAGGAALIDKLRGSESLGGAYDARLKEIRDYQKAFNKQSSDYGGIAEPVVKLGGAIALPGGLAKKGTTVLGKTGLAALEGGAVGGLYGADAANGGLEDRLQGAKEGATTGAALSAALGAPLFAAEKLAPKLNEAGQAMQRSSLGAKASTYKKGVKDLGVWDIIDDKVEVPIKKVLNEMIDNPELGRGRNAEKLLAKAISKEKQLGDKIGEIIKARDTGAVRPKWNRTLEVISDGKLPANDINKYFESLLELDDAIKAHGKGSLEFLQQQKITFGSRWDAGNPINNKFFRAIYQDLQRTIEEAAPEVKGLNSELGKWKTMRKLFEQNAAAEASNNASKSLIQGLRTSGGVLTTPTLIGAGLGGASGGPIGLAAGAALGAASTPAGKNAVGAGLRTLSKNASIFGKAGEGSPSILGRLAGDSIQPGRKGNGNPQFLGNLGIDDANASPLDAINNKALLGNDKLPMSEGIGQQKKSSQSQAEILGTSPNKLDPQNTSESRVFNALLDAMKQVESGGKRNAISNKGAKGPYQFLDVTAKQYGLIDPFDEPSARKAAAAKLLDDWEKFGDIRLALAAYNAGRGKVGKLLDQVDGSTYDDIAHLLPKETQAYIPKIEKVFAKLIG